MSSVDSRDRGHRPAMSVRFPQSKRHLGAGAWALRKSGCRRATHPSPGRVVRRPVIGHEGLRLGRTDKGESGPVLNQPGIPQVFGPSAPEHSSRGLRLVRQTNPRGVSRLCLATAAMQHFHCGAVLQYCGAGSAGTPLHRSTAGTRGPGRAPDAGSSDVVFRPARAEADWKDPGPAGSCGSLEPQWRLPSRIRRFRSRSGDTRQQNPAGWPR